MDIDFNIPTIITKRNVDSGGNPISVKLIEIRQIMDNYSCVVLSQTPDQFNRIYIEGFTEVFDIERLDKKNFKVDYSQGIIYFHPFNIGKAISIEYYGTGYELISASRVFTKVDKHGNIIDTLEEILNRASLQLKLIESLGGAIKVIEKLDEDIKNANNLNAYFDEMIPEATGLKNELDTIVTDAKGWKDQLKQDVADGKILQPLLHNDVIQGREVKQQLDQSIADAQDDIAKIEATGNEIVYIISSEWVYNDISKMYEKQIGHNCNSENLHVTCRATDGKDALFLPWKPVGKSNILLKSDEAINVSVIISASYYKAQTTISDDIAEEVVNARKGKTSLLEKVDSIDMQLESIVHIENDYKFNPVYYGADPTGVRDSAEAINRCIQENLGKSIVFTPGKYLINSPINTPYYTDEQVNINFNGATLYSEKSLEYVVGIGYYNSGSDMPNHNEYNNKSNYAIIENLVIDCNNSRIGILTKQNYWYPRLKNISIFNTIIGIQSGTDSSVIWSSDLYMENIYIQCKSYKNRETIGIILNGNDNKIFNTRIYNAHIGMKLNKDANFLNNVHVYLYGHFNDRSDSNFGSIYQTTIAIEDNGNNNYYNTVYTDSYSTHYKITTKDYIGKIINCFQYTNVTGFDDIAFDFSSSANIRHITINNCNINLKNSGKNGNIGIKRSTTQKDNDMCKLWNISNNYTSYIEKDILLIDMNKPWALPFSDSYTTTPETYYIVGYIPVVNGRHSYTVNITGTGSSNQRGRYYINGNGDLTEINNLGSTGNNFGLGGKIVTLKDGFKYIEVSIMVNASNPSWYGVSFDVSIDGYNLGIIPIYERHINGDPNNCITTPSITQTFGY